MGAVQGQLPRGTVPTLLFLVGVLLRLPSLALPLGASDAALAVAADELGRARWPDLHGHGPLLPLLLALPVAAGASAVVALRLLGVLLGALAPLLFHRLALRLGLDGRAAALAGLLLALHPVLIAHAGGPEAGAQGLALVLLLVAGLRVVGNGEGTRRTPFLFALLATLAWPAAAPYLLLVAVWALAAERGWKARAAVIAPVALALGLALYAGSGKAAGPIALLALALPALGLVVLLPAIGVGWLRLLRRLDPSRRFLAGWSSAVLLHAVLLGTGLLRPGSVWGWEAAAPTVLLAPFLVLCAVEGLAALARGWRLRLGFAALAFALLAALLAGLGPAQAGLLGGHLGPAGRQHDLGVAARLAQREAGPAGWVALDLGRERLDEARALALWLGERTLVTPESGGPTSAPEGWPLGGPPSLALLTASEPAPGQVTTLGGFGIFAQEHAGRSGPYHVLRVRRP